MEVYASSFGEVFSLPLPIAQGIQPSTFLEREICILVNGLICEGNMKSELARDVSVRTSVCLSNVTCILKIPSVVFSLCVVLSSCRLLSTSLLSKIQGWPLFIEIHLDEA